MTTNFQDPTLRAIVAPTDFLFGMMRMFQTRGAATREQLHIVRTLNEALGLLGVVSPQFQRTDGAVMGSAPYYQDLSAGLPGT